MLGPGLLSLALSWSAPVLRGIAGALPPLLHPLLALPGLLGTLQELLRIGSVPDLLRLVAVPVFGWAAWRDVRTRRVPNAAWFPLVALGAILLFWEGARHYPFADFGSQLFLTRVGVSLLFVAPLAYLFWRLGGFGGADAKAMMALAILFPTYPTYSVLPFSLAPGFPFHLALPLVDTTLGVFSLTVVTNAVIVGLVYPLALGVRNALRGRLSPAMFLARLVDVEDLPATHGRLFEDREGFTRTGLDLDALRMYLRWRGVALSELRASPKRFRDPQTVGPTHEPTDGAVHVARTDGGEERDPADPEPDRAAGGESDQDEERGPDQSADADEGADAGGFEWVDPQPSAAPQVDSRQADVEREEGPGTTPSGTREKPDPGHTTTPAESDVDATEPHPEPDLEPETEAPKDQIGEPSAEQGEEPSTEPEAEPSTEQPQAPTDPWAAERFLEEIDRSAYGTRPEQLREGLETVCEREVVWVSPGLPFVVPMFVGLLVALTYGDVLFGVLRLLGLT